MMENNENVHQTSKPHIPQAAPSNDNRHKPLSMGRSVFPDDAVARIYRPSRSAMTSGVLRLSRR